MKKIQLIIIIILISLGLFAQPTTFSWALRHGHTSYNYSYISPAKDQVIQGPCHVFASVAAVEAMAHIYYNKLTANPGVDLSESFLYNESGDGMSCNASDVNNVLVYIRDDGVIDEAGYGYRGECSYDQVDPDSMNYCITIPRFKSYTEEDLSTDIDIKKAIFNKGPLVVTLEAYSGQYGHSLLLLGWGAGVNSWHVKDSWPLQESIKYITIDLSESEHNPKFYSIVPLYNNEEIQTIDGECTYLSMSTPVDEDLDGWYNWGLDSLKPSGWPGVSLMDFDDSNPDVSFFYNNEVNGRTAISGPNYLCAENEFILSNIPAGLQQYVSWSATNCTPSSGNGSTAEVTPSSSYLGKNCKITFTLTYNGTKSWEKNFIINGPDEDEVIVSVLDSYSGTPPNYSDTYYICPNTTYTISYNNYDYCQTSNFEWDLPYGWSTHWEYNNSISISTNDYPYGMVDIYAETCCSDIPVIVYTLYFAEGYCEGEFLIYPNPSENNAYIDINRNKVDMVRLSPQEEFTISVIDRSGTTKLSSKFKGLPYEMDTSNLPEGIYFINLRYRDKKTTLRLSVEH